MSIIKESEENAFRIITIMSFYAEELGYKTYKVVYKRDQDIAKMLGISYVDYRQFCQRCGCKCKRDFYIGVYNFVHEPKVSLEYFLPFFINFDIVEKLIFLGLTYGFTQLLLQEQLRDLLLERDENKYYAVLARCYHALGESNFALQYFKKVKENVLQYISRLYYLTWYAKVLGVNQNAEEMLKDVKKIIEDKDKPSEEEFLYLGRSLHRLGNLATDNEEALKLYEEASYAYKKANFEIGEVCHIPLRKILLSEAKCKSLILNKLLEVINKAKDLHYARGIATARLFRAKYAFANHEAYYADLHESMNLARKRHFFDIFQEAITIFKEVKPNYSNPLWPWEKISYPSE